MNDIFRALATSAAILFPVVVLIVIISIAAVKRGEASIGGHAHGHDEVLTEHAAVSAPSTAAKSAKAAPADEINVGQILLYGVGLFTLTILALLGLSLIQHLN